VKKPFHSRCFNNGGTSKFRAVKMLRAALSAPRFQHSGSRRSCTVEDCRVLIEELIFSLGGPLPSEVLRIKRAESGADCRADPHDAFFHVWPKKRNPKITSEKQLWPAHRRWASRMLHAIMLHLLHGRCRIIPRATSAQRITVMIHLPLQNA